MYDELVLFIKVVKLGSFADASKFTGVSASNLTRRIQKLEEELGFTLLKRDTRTLVLSNSGKMLYDKFANIETDLKTTIAYIEKERDEISGLLSVLIPPFFALKVITPYLVNYLIKYPKITLNITNESRPTNLIKENFDLAILNHRPLKSSQKIKLLYKSRIIFYCYPSYITKFGLPSSQQEVEKNLIMGIMLDHGIKDKTTYIINKQTGLKKIFNHKYRIIQHSGSHDDELARSGLVIAAGEDILLKNDIDSGEIINVLPDFYLTGFDYYLLINPEGKNARTETFIDFINECMHRLHLNKGLELE